MKWKTFAIAAIALGLTVGVFFRDLLASAFEHNPIPQSAESVARGEQIYMQRCAACHGVGGKGNGPAAASIPDRMDDLSHLPAAPVFPDGVVAYRIANGKGLMPAWKDILSRNDIWDLLNFIRSLRPASKS